MPDTRSPLAFVTEHLDNCEHCSIGNFCAEGRKLMDRASDVAAAFIAPIPPIPRSPWKA